MTLEAAKQAILERFPELQVDEGFRGGLGLLLPAERLLEVGRWLRDEPSLRLDLFHGMTAVDWQDRFAVVYWLESSEHPELRVQLKVELPHDEPEIESVTGLWPGADWHEREAWDLVGVRFRNHPDLRRILTWEGYEGHPLRRDFVDRRPKRPRKVRIR
ncbi:MAG: NADH-quinone oxidoreductase subunit C [Clostridia bacterium]|nr:NADH-quinone oxidoreductase subunit C [Clostridia bacterium]MCL6522125.1 NADH-quinone oxidoreductase subunit C [Bacillota bacterium]